MQPDIDNDVEERKPKKMNGKNKIFLLFFKVLTLNII